MTYYLRTVMPRSYTDRLVSIISYISSYRCIYDLVPKGQCAQVHAPKPLCVLRRAPNAYILSVSSYLVCIIISRLYHHIPSVSSVSQYMHLCNHYTACICSQKAKVPKHTAQSLYVCLDGPYRPLISSHIICITVSGGDGFQ